MNGRVEERNGKFLLVLDLGRGDNGKRKRQVITTEHKGRRAAEKQLVAVLAELHKGTHQTPQKQTLAAFLRQWLEGTAQMRVSTATWHTYESDIRTKIIPALGAYRLDALTPALIQATWAKLLEKGLSPGSIRNAHAALNTALETAVKQGLLAKNPCALVDRPRKRKPDLAILTPPQINQLLDGLRGNRWYLPTLIACTTAMRRGEIMALRWSDIDLTAGTITVARALEQTAKGIAVKEPKSGKGRSFKMPARLAEELKAYRIAQATVAGLLFCHPDGSPIRPDTLSQMFRKHMQMREDLPRVRFHDLRHSVASFLLALKEPVPNVSAILGHSSPHVTLTTYAHVIASSLEGTAARIDEALREAR